MSTRAITRTGTRGGSGEVATAGAEHLWTLRNQLNDGLYSLPEREQQFLRPEKILMIAWDASSLWKNPHKPWNILAENVPFEMVKQCTGPTRSIAWQCRTASAASRLWKELVFYVLDTLVYKEMNLVMYLNVERHSFGRIYVLPLRVELVVRTCTAKRRWWLFFFMVADVLGSE